MNFKLCTQHPSPNIFFGNLWDAQWESIFLEWLLAGHISNVFLPALDEWIWISLFTSVCYLFSHRLLPVQINRRINNLAKKATFSSNGTWAMGFGPLDGGKNGEHTAVGLVEISKISAVRHYFFCWGWIILPKNVLTYGDNTISHVGKRAFFLAAWPARRNVFCEVPRPGLVAATRYRHFLINAARSHYAAWPR